MATIADHFWTAKTGGPIDCGFTRREKKMQKKLTQKKEETKSTFKYKHMGVSKNTGTPKWMVYNGKPY